MRPEPGRVREKAGRATPKSGRHRPKLVRVSAERGRFAESSVPLRPKSLGFDGIFVRARAEDAGSDKKSEGSDKKSIRALQNFVPVCQECVPLWPE